MPDGELGQLTDRELLVHIATRVKTIEEGLADCRKRDHEAHSEIFGRIGRLEVNSATVKTDFGAWKKSLDRNARQQGGVFGSLFGAIGGFLGGFISGFFGAHKGG